MSFHSEPAAFLEQNDIQTVRVEWPDLHGLARGKHLSTPHFLESLTTGVPFASASLHMDIQGNTPSYSALRTPHSALLQGWPNLFARPDLSTLRLLPPLSRSVDPDRPASTPLSRSVDPDRPTSTPLSRSVGEGPGVRANTATVIADLFCLDGSPVTQSPRFALQQVVQNLKDAGLQPLLGAEIEFYLLPDPFPLSPLPQRGRGAGGEGTPHQVHRLLLSSLESPFLSDLTRYLDLIGVQCETCSAEDGPAQFELALSPQDPLSLADAAFLARNAAKEIAARHSLSATFLSKPLPQQAGSGFHLHQSLTPLSHSVGEGPGVRATHNSRLLHSFLAGQLSLLPDACALYLPTVNSYKRLFSRGPQPLSATWGIENRTTALRLIPTGGLAHSQTSRLENRLPAGEANPYLVAAVALASGLYGIQNNLQPPKPISHNAFEKPTPSHPLPPTLRHALVRLKQSKILPTLLPPDLLLLFHALKSQELSSFESSTTDWELSTYLPWL